MLLQEPTQVLPYRPSVVKRARLLRASLELCDRATGTANQAKCALYPLSAELLARSQRQLAGAMRLQRWADDSHRAERGAR